MTTKQPTKEEVLEALHQKGINNLEDLVDAIMPETGGYGSIRSGVEGFGDQPSGPTITTPYGTFAFAPIPGMF